MFLVHPVDGSEILDSPVGGWYFLPLFTRFFFLTFVYIQNGVDFFLGGISEPPWDHCPGLVAPSVKAMA